MARWPVIATIILVPLAAGIVIGVGDVVFTFSGGEFGGIALGTVVVVLGYHLLRRLAPTTER